MEIAGVLFTRVILSIASINVIIFKEKNIISTVAILLRMNDKCTLSLYELKYHFTWNLLNTNVCESLEHLEKNVM